MDRDNAPGAANQQERLDAYLAGFVDGEGTFHVAVCRSASAKAGFQLVPEFHVSQSPERRQVLDLLEQRLAAVGSERTIVGLATPRWSSSSDGDSTC